MASLKQNSNTSDIRYIPVINSLRGVASVLVCIYHLICQPANFFQNTILHKYAEYGACGVDIFFVITGIVIPISLIVGNYQYINFGRFILKRAIRIEPPYLASILIYLLFIIIRNHLSEKYVPLPTTGNLLLHLGYLIPFVKGQTWIIGVYWTLAIEFQFYILISLIFPLLISKNYLLRIICYFIMLSSFLLFPNYFFAPVWLPVFMLGIIYVSWRFNKISFYEFCIIASASIVVIFISHDIVITLFTASTLLVIHFFQNYKSKIGNFFGNISYSLYLTHWIFGLATVNLLLHYGKSIYLKLLVVLIGFVVSVLAAYVFYLLVERASKKMASKIKMATKA